MAIPNGYRLLTKDDVGKTFGVDLESTVYFDTSLFLPNPYSSSVIYFTNFISFNYLNEESWYINNTAFNITQVFLIDSYTFTENVEITSYNTNYQDWNDFLYVKDIVDPKEQFITDMNSLAESIVGKAGSSGKKTIKEMKSLVDGLKTEFITQEKTVTPTKSSQSITPDSGKDGLSKVTVNAIPSNYIIPSGSLNITENGTHDVTSKASVLVNVAGGSTGEEWDGSYTESDLGYNVTLQFTATNNISYTIDDGETITTDVTSGTEIPLQVSSTLKIRTNSTALDYNNESNLNVTTWNTPNATWVEGIYTITEDCTITLGYSTSGNPEPI